MGSVLEFSTRDPSAAAQAHDALWAALWNRRYDDVQEPVWFPDAAYAGFVVFAWRFPDGGALTGLDTNDALVIFRDLTVNVPIGSRVRVLPADREQWRLAEGARQLGVGIDLRFDNPHPSTQTAWLATLRAAVQRLRGGLEARREQLAGARSQLGAQSEPPAVEDLWRAQVAAITQRITAQTDYTAAELSALARARAKGARGADEEQRIHAARRKRFTELGNAQVERFRQEAWPELHERAAERVRAYAEYHDKVVKLEDALQRVRAYLERAMKAATMLERIERAGFDVRAIAFDETRLAQAGYAEEILRTIELLHDAIPLRGESTTTRFSAYRAPTAGPAIVPPRPI